MRNSISRSVETVSISVDSEDDFAVLEFTDESGGVLFHLGREQVEALAEAFRSVNIFMFGAGK